MVITVLVVFPMFFLFTVFTFFRVLGLLTVLTVFAHFLEEPRGEESKDADGKEPCDKWGSVSLPTQKHRPKREGDRDKCKSPLGFMPNEHVQTDNREEAWQERGEPAVNRTQAAGELSERIYSVARFRRVIGVGSHSSLSLLWFVELVDLHI